MPEVYTCSCGNQKWIILGSEIICSTCGKRYTIPITGIHSKILPAFYFNDNKEAHEKYPKSNQWVEIKTDGKIDLIS